MKSLSQTLFSILALCIFATPALAETLEESVGTWTVIARNCSDGSPADDRFVLGRDLMELTITPTKLGAWNEAALYTRIEEETHYIKGTGGESTLTFERANRKKETLTFNIFGGWKMAITSTGFGEGGTCKQGESLTTLLQRTSEPNR